MTPQPSSRPSPDRAAEKDRLLPLPTRLCCGLKHVGVVCPDGKVMCCLCFSRFVQGDLFTYPGDDKPSDVCRECGSHDIK